MYNLQNICMLIFIKIFDISILKITGKKGILGIATYSNTLEHSLLFWIAVWVMCQ